jgi:hypothetical protein
MTRLQCKIGVLNIQNKRNFAKWNSERKARLKEQERVEAEQRNFEARVKTLAEEQLKMKATKLDEEFQEKLKQLQTKESETEALQRKLEEEFQEKLQQLQTKESEMEALQRKLEEEFQEKLQQLQIKESEIETTKKLQQKLEEEYQAKLKQLQIKESEMEIIKRKVMIPIDLYLSGAKVGKCIGEGHFGKAFIGEWSRIQVALKSFKLGLEEVEKEVSTFK